MSGVSLAQTDGIALITLNRPEKRNAIDLTLAEELLDALERAEADDSVHACILTGAGPSFCSGADRSLLARADERTLRAVYEPFLRIRSSVLPVIAAVNGPAVGAGFNLALACDLRVAGHSATFQSRFLQLPIHPGGGHTWMLQQAVGAQAAVALCLLDQPMDGPEAERIRLAWRCVPDADLIDTCHSLLSRLVGSPTPELARMVKATLQQTAGLDLPSSVELELERQLRSTSSEAFRTRIGGR
jgi:enoyl-CoA hydratase